MGTQKKRLNETFFVYNCVSKLYLSVWGNSIRIQRVKIYTEDNFRGKKYGERIRINPYSATYNLQQMAI